MMSGSWNRFCRCITALTVSGRSSSRVHLATSIFLRVGALEAGDAVGDDRLVALKADLHMAQPGIRQRCELFAGQQHGGRDEIGIKPDIAGVPDQFDQVLARGRLAAGEMDLQHADLGEFGQYLLPFRRW